MKEELLWQANCCYLLMVGSQGLHWVSVLVACGCTKGVMEYDYDMQNIHRVRVIFFLILPRNVDKLLDTMPYGTSDMYINIQQGHIWMDT